MAEQVFDHGVADEQVALGAGNAVADLRAMAAPTTPAAEVGENFQRAAGYVPPGPGTEVDDPYDVGDRKVVERERDNWKAVAEKRRTMVEALTARVSVLEAQLKQAGRVQSEDVEVEQGDGFYWMNRARRAEGALRQVSNLIVAAGKRVRKAEDLLRNWKEAGDVKRVD